MCSWQDDDEPRRKNWADTVFVIVLVLALALGFALSARGETQRHESHTVMLDGRVYSAVDMNPDLWICILEDDGGVRGMQLPPGSMVLIPVPESAPVDSL